MKAKNSYTLIEIIVVLSTIADEDGDRFGPTWKAECGSTRDNQTKEACGVDAAEVRAVEREVNS